MGINDHDCGQSHQDDSRCSSLSLVEHADDTNGIEFIQDDDNGEDLYNLDERDEVNEEQQQQQQQQPQQIQRPDINGQMVMMNNISNNVNNNNDDDTEPAEPSGDSHGGRRPQMNSVASSNGIVANGGAEPQLASPLPPVAEEPAQFFSSTDAEFDELPDGRPMAADSNVHLNGGIIGGGGYVGMSDQNNDMMMMIHEADILLEATGLPTASSAPNESLVSATSNLANGLVESPSLTTTASMAGALALSSSRTSPPSNSNVVVVGNEAALVGHFSNGSDLGGPGGFDRSLSLLTNNNEHLANSQSQANGGLVTTGPTPTTSSGLLSAAQQRILVQRDRVHHQAPPPMHYSIGSGAGNEQAQLNYQQQQQQQQQQQIGSSIGRPNDSAVLGTSSLGHSIISDVKEEEEDEDEDEDEEEEQQQRRQHHQLDYQQRQHPEQIQFNDRESNQETVSLQQQLHLSDDIGGSGDQNNPNVRRPFQDLSQQQQNQLFNPSPSAFQRQLPIGGSVRLRGENIKQIYRGGFGGTLKTRQQRDKEAANRQQITTLNTNLNEEQSSNEAHDGDKLGKLPSFKRNQSVSFRTGPLRRNRHSIDIRNLPSYLSNKRTSIVDVALGAMSSLFSGSSNSQQQQQPQYEESSDEPIFEEPIAPTLSLGQRVALVKADGSDFGTVGWIGRLPQFEDEWAVGVIFDNAIGDSDGEINGIRYFQARENYAMFMPLSALTKTENYIGRPETGTLLSRMSVSLRPGQMISIQRSTVRLQHCFLNAPHQRVGHDVRAVSNRLHCQCHNCGPCAHLTKQGRFTALAATSSSYYHHRHDSITSSLVGHGHHHHHRLSSQSQTHHNVCSYSGVDCCQQLDTKPSLITDGGWPIVPPPLSLACPDMADGKSLPGRRRHRHHHRRHGGSRRSRHSQQAPTSSAYLIQPLPPPMLDTATLDSIIGDGPIGVNDSPPPNASAPARHTLDSTSSHDLDETRYYADLETARLARRQSKRHHKKNRPIASEASSTNEMFGVKSGALTESSLSSVSSSCSSSSLSSSSLSLAAANEQLPYHDGVSLRRKSLDSYNDPVSNQQNAAVRRFSNNVPNPSMPATQPGESFSSSITHHQQRTLMQIGRDDEDNQQDNDNYGSTSIGHVGFAKRLRLCMSCFLLGTARQSGQQRLVKPKRRKLSKKYRMMEYRRKQSTFVPSTLARPREDFASHGITHGSIKEENSSQCSSYSSYSSSSSSSADDHPNYMDGFVGGESAGRDPLHDEESYHEGVAQTLQLEHRHHGGPQNDQNSNYAMNILRYQNAWNGHRGPDTDNISYLSSQDQPINYPIKAELPNDESRDSALADIGDLPNDDHLEEITSSYYQEKNTAAMSAVNNNRIFQSEGIPERDINRPYDVTSPTTDEGLNESRSHLHSPASICSSTVTISTATTTDGAQNSLEVSSLTADSPNQEQLLNQFRRLDLDREDQQYGQ